MAGIPRRFDIVVSRLATLGRVSIVYLLSTLAFGFVILSSINNPLRINNDVALDLLVADRLLAGTTPYAGYMHINPPLIHYLLAIPTLLARLLRVNPIVAFNILILGLTAFSMVMALRILRDPQDDRRAAILQSSVVFVIAALTLRLAVTGALGEREHIFVLLYIPYFLLRWRRSNGDPFPDRWTGPVVGLLAGLGVCIKPHFLIVWGAVELFLALRSSSLRKIITTEFVTAIVVGALYALHFLFLPAQSREGISEILRLIGSGAYAAYGDHSPLSIIAGDLVLLWLALLPFVLIRDPHDKVGSLARLSAVFLLSSLVEVGVQQRGFFYHGIPVWTATYLIVVTSIVNYGAPVALTLVGPASMGRVKTLLKQIPLLAAYGALLALFIGWANIISPSQFALILPSEPGPLVSYLAAHTGPSDSIFVISPGADLFRSVLQADRRVASKYFPSFPIAFSLHDIGYGPSLYERGSSLPASLVEYLDDVGEESLQEQPEIIIIDNNPRCIGCPPSLNLYDLLFAIGFTPRVILPSYQDVGVFDGGEIFTRTAN